MEIPKVYSPGSIEAKWYQYWLDKRYFRSVPDSREPYTIVIPPPNVTGVLHMGHMLNNTIQDVLIRRARMLGKNACWVPGTDHASIATEARVVALLKEKGIDKKSIGRQEFLKHAWEWKEKYGGIILDQLKKLGASCDWDRTRFTMDEEYYRDVIKVFCDLYNKGHIYRGMRLVNWDPVARTAVSDEEVNFKATQSKMVYVRYKYESGDGYMVVATVRPETIMGDVAVAVHPEDERYKHLHGKKVIVPLVNRAVPVICDSAIDKEFGTGCLKVTPAHDIVDYEIGLRHRLPVIDVLNEDGTISETAGVYIGLDRFAARKQSIIDLTEQGLVEKTEDYSNNVGYSERTNAAIEPRLSMQWFLKMKEISKPAYEAVVNGEVNLIPGKFINTYKYWMENVKDWCLSRQLWWGHRIPAWYNDKGDFVVAYDEREAIQKFAEKNLNYKSGELKQDDDVLDTWASSWLWPISVFDGIEHPDNDEIKYYYPTNDLVTAPEILFFWVARMILAGYEYRDKKPFQNVYLTGIVRDKLGRKMSKSLGNSPDPLDLIEKYGADGVRVGMLLCSPAGNDLLFDESYLEQGRNFANKVWNAFRLIHGFEKSGKAQPDVCKKACDWFENRLAEQLTVINDHYSKYRISDALMATYKLVWDDYCAWFLEMIKPEFINGKSSPIDEITYQRSVEFLEALLKIMHPFMPFLTEEIWHFLNERKSNEAIIVSEWPIYVLKNADLVKGFEVIKQTVMDTRNIRQSKGLSPKQALPLYIKPLEHEKAFFINYSSAAGKLLNLNLFEIVNEKKSNAFFYLSGTTECYLDAREFVKQDDGTEKKKVQEEIEYLKGFLISVQKKLSNEKFVANAKPEILENEKKKQSDAETKIKVLEEQLTQL
jgi:valyl-tRNA synthetase